MFIGGPVGYRELYLDATPCGWRNGPLALRFIGVPFDGTVSYRPGTRLGPAAFRQALMNIEVYSPRYDTDLEEYSVSDLGDVRAAWTVEQTVDAVQKLVSQLMAESEAPLLIVGGEHTLTYGSFRAMREDTGLLVFDAHLDLRDEYAGLKLGHATFLRRLLASVGPERVVHVGARAATRQEWSYAREQGITLVDERALRDMDAAVERVAEALRGFREVYVSIDLDVLDPAFAPGVSNPEPGGMSVRELLTLLEPLKSVAVPCFDIVELSPLYDSGTTAAVAARLAVEVASTQIRRRGG